MEEEIIIPDEEVFNYHSLRYILDKNGYVCHASLGGLVVCDLGECTEYKGEVPSDYSTIEEWYDGELEKLNAWKVIEGNLVYDANRYNELKRIYEEEAEKNKPATHEYVDNKVSGIKVENRNIKDLFDRKNVSGFEITTLNDSSEFEIDRLIIYTNTDKEKINLVFSTSNLLYHELTRIEKEGIEFIVDKDKSIRIEGSSKSSFEIDILGDSENTNPFFMLKKDIEYILSGLENVTLNMYSNDGTNRSQIYSGTGGSILFTDENKPITNITLSLNGTYDTTIYPKLNFGNEELEYEEAKYELITINLPNYNLYPSDVLYPSEDLFPSFSGDITIKVENGKVYVVNDSEEEIGTITMPKTFYPKTTVYTYEENILSLDYVTSFSNGVPYDEIIKAINDSPETIKISADKLDIDAIATFTNSKLANAGSTVINGANITTGSISCDRLNGGTINGQNFSGGSISIARGEYYFNMGLSTSNPNCSGLNVGTKGINVNNLGFNSNGSQFTFAGGISTPYLTATQDLIVNGDITNYGSLKTNNINPSGVLNLLSGGSSGSASNTGILIRSGGGHISLDASNNGANTSYGVYARGLGLANSSVSTNSGQASSRNTKENIVKFEEEDYEQALNLLKDINLYSYDYKYNLYRKTHQYGFIIDEIEKQENYDKYFDFYESKAKVNGKDLNFEVDEIDEDLITVKQYHSDTLDKYMLTCIKALQEKIEKLENKIKELESDK